MESANVATEPTGQPSPEVQPPAGGQGQPGTGTPDGSKGAEGGFNWDLFPDVPEDQRPLAEPIARQMQGHVTRMEQQMAPLKPLFDQGLDPESVAALGGFAVGFNQDPVQAWVDLARQMQQHQLLPTDLDIDAVYAAASGQAVADGGVEGQPVAGGDQQGVDPQVAQLMQRIEQLEQGNSQREATETRNQQQAQLDNALTEMRTALNEAKVPEPPERLLVAAIVSNDGDHNAAVQEMVSWRNGSLRAVAEPEPTEGQEDLNMPKGSPSTKKSKSRGRGGAWGEARQGAAQMLKQRRNAAAQE